jgi:periplasmic divalent cation tolerance protein
MSLDHMSAGTEYCVVLTTCASEEDGRRLALALLDQRLAACVQALGIRSYYTWQGTSAEEPEQLLLIKTRTALYDQVEAALQAIHPYETPEIVCLPLVAGAPSYLGWITAMTAAPGR